MKTLEDLGYEKISPNEYEDDSHFQVRIEKDNVVFVTEDDKEFILPVDLMRACMQKYEER